VLETGFPMPTIHQAVHRPAHEPRPEKGAARAFSATTTASGIDNVHKWAIERPLGYQKARGPTRGYCQSRSAITKGNGCIEACGGAMCQLCCHPSLHTVSMADGPRNGIYPRTHDARARGCKSEARPSPLRPEIAKQPCFTNNPASDPFAWRN